METETGVRVERPDSYDLRFVAWLETMSSSGDWRPLDSKWKPLPGWDKPMVTSGCRVIWTGDTRAGSMSLHRTSGFLTASRLILSPEFRGRKIAEAALYVLISYCDEKGLGFRVTSFGEEIKRSFFDSLGFEAVQSSQDDSVAFVLQS